MKKEGEIHKKEKNYPQRLREIPDAPSVLHYKGIFQENLFKNTLAVVGSRRMTSYGKRVTEYIVKELALSGITIVSGFMYGIDATAHNAALSVRGKTVAVLPCGVNIIHPAHQEKLYKEIVESGLILSEYEDNFPPDKWTYPRRNRIVVGLSLATLVVEAAKKSGSLISAEITKKYKRKLFAVPGPIFNKTSEGTNSLIKEGATPVTSPEDILSFFQKNGSLGKKGKKKDIFLKKLGEKEKKVLKILKKEPQEADEIIKESGFSTSEINTILSTLEIEGFLKKEGRRYYILRY